MPTGTWDLAVIELVFFTPPALPVFYCTWAYRQTALMGWIFIDVFILLQLTGSGLVVGAGEQGQPSSTAIILISVGLSPLLVGVAGILDGWAKATGYYKTPKSKTAATIILILYHIAVITAIAIYATGLSNAAKPSIHSSGQTMGEAGILLLLLLLLFLVGAFIILVVTSRSHPLRPILFSIATSLLLLKVRIIYQCVAVFRNYTYSTESIALKVIFQFLPVALILLALVTGGVMAARKQKEVYEAVRMDISLASRGT